MYLFFAAAVSALALLGAVIGAKTKNRKLQAVSVAAAALVLLGNVLFAIAS